MTSMLVGQLFPEQKQATMQNHMCASLWAVVTGVWDNEYKCPGLSFRPHLVPSYSVLLLSCCTPLCTLYICTLTGEGTFETIQLAPSSPHQLGQPHQQHEQATCSPGLRLRDSLFSLTLMASASMRSFPAPSKHFPLCWQWGLRTQLLSPCPFDLLVLMSVKSFGM